MTYICTFHIDKFAPKQEASSSKKIELRDYLNINLVYLQKTKLTVDEALVIWVRKF